MSGLDSFETHSAIAAANSTFPLELLSVVDRDTLDQLLGTFSDATGLQCAVLDSQARYQAGSWRDCPVCGQALDVRLQSRLERREVPEFGVLRCRCGIAGVSAPLVSPTGRPFATVIVGPYIASDTDLSTISNWRTRMGVQAGSIDAAAKLPRLTATKSMAIATLLAQTLKLVVSEDLLASESAGLLLSQRQINTELSALYAVVGALNSEVELHRMLQRLVDSVGETVWRDVVSVWLVEDGHVVIKASRGMLTADSKRARLKIGTGFAGQVAATGESLVCSDIQKDPRLHMRANVSREGIHGQAGVPIKLHGRTVGVLSLHSRLPHEFSASDLSLLERIAEDAAVAIERAGLHEHERQSVLELQRLNAAIEADHAMLRRASAINDRLTQMVLARRSLQAIVDTLGGLIGHPVALLDCRLCPVASTAPGPGAAAPQGRRELLMHPELRMIVDRTQHERRPACLGPAPAAGITEARIIAPVILVGDIVAYLTVACNWPLEDADVLVAEQSATLIALAMMNEWTALEVEYRVRGDLLEDLIAGDSNKLLKADRRAGFLGHDLHSPHVLLVIDLGGNPQGSDQHSQRLLEQRIVTEIVAELCPRRDGGGVDLVGLCRDRIVVAVPADPTERAGDFAKALQERLTQRSPNPVIVGLSDVCTQPADFARAFGETCRLLELARCLRFGGQIVSLESMRMYRVLLGLARPADALIFADEILGPLEDLDEENNSSFIRTLEAYLGHNGMLQRAAEELDVHVNTISYRLHRIRSLAGLDLEDSGTRLQLQLALQIRRAAGLLAS